ncbi:MAG: type II/IV secretion system protein [Phycisphaerales bacterium]|nr:type II/IV secretion system protein [Phycisphaerales bacterium]
MSGAERSVREQHDVTDLVAALLTRAVASRATDVHFEPTDDRLWVRVRVDGLLIDFEEVPLALAPNIVARLKVLSSLLTYRTDIPQEGSLQWPVLHPAGGEKAAGGEKGAGGDKEARGEKGAGGAAPSADHVWDLRVATFPTIRGERAVVRIFRERTSPQSLVELGFTEVQDRLMRSAVEQPAGLIVVCGPAGSGKTTTLYALMHDLRERFPQRSLITLEDPVEQRIDRVTQIQINPYGELNYERCLRSLLRQDPQVLLVGEIRDGRTADIVVQAALTGHLILTTLHGEDPATAIVRFLEMGIPAYQLASTLSLVCAQRLVRTVCRSCAPAARRGCRDCLGTGYRGRTALAQVCPIHEELRSLILHSPSASALRAALHGLGLSMTALGKAAVQRGTTTEDELRRVLGAEAAD